MKALLERPQTTPFEIEPITYPEIASAIAEKRDEYMALEITDLADKQQLAVVHAARMTIKNARVEVEKRRKELKASSLEYGRRVDGAARELTALLEPIEAHLDAEENKVAQEQARIKREAEEKRRAKTQARIDRLAGVKCHLPFAEVESWPDEVFESNLAKATKAHEIAVAEAAERQRKAEAEAASLKAEQDRLAKERDELDRQRREQAEKEAELQAEKNRLAEAEAARKRAEELEQAKAEAAAKAKAEAEEAARLAAAEKERKAAEAAAEAAEEQRRIEAARPDREKLLAFAENINGLLLPSIEDQAAREYVGGVLKNAARDIVVCANSLRG